jgi:hypothetical protein
VLRGLMSSVRYEDEDESWLRTRTDDEESVKTSLTDNSVEMGVYEDETWTGTPMTKKTGLDMVVGEVLLEEDVVVEENHGWNDVGIEVYKKTGYMRTCSDVIGSSPEKVDSPVLILG